MENLPSAANCSGEVRRADTVTPRSAVLLRGGIQDIEPVSQQGALPLLKNIPWAYLHSSHGMYKAAGCGKLWIL